ncbi:MAG: Ycf66 family protein, partial [Geitlerinemataceae cyanobacterium]
MLSYILATIVGLGSVAFYMAAFFFPEVYRKGDFVWSGVGFFYALVLWFCAGQIGGAVLLGQTASVALVAWLGWQTLILRRETTPLAEQTSTAAIDRQGISPTAIGEKVTNVFKPG